jgi:hypothetical protein
MSGVLVSRRDQRFQVFSPDQKARPQPTHVFSLFVKIFLGRGFGEEAQKELTARTAAAEGEIVNPDSEGQCGRIRLRATGLTRCIYAALSESRSVSSRLTVARKLCGSIGFGS